MKIDLLHNKIVKDNITPAFEKCFTENLVPALVERYGDELSAIQMYEDYLSDGFVLDGYFYYPLSLLFGGEAARVWIRWDISKKSDFEGGVPYAYSGSGELSFEICDEIPEGFSEKLFGRGIYFEGGCASFKIESASTDKTFLVGKYSQTFVDELNRQISAEIISAFSLAGFDGSSVEIMLVFAPSTYMEHIFAGVTYRRLLISARGCNARDLWIKWSRSDGTEPLTVSDNVSADEVIFELGEDVPQKIREKEYRFLVHTSADKYQAAMGRKNITEWRDLIKRAIKRGELIKVESFEPVPEKDAEITARLEEMLSKSASAPAVDSSEPVAEDNINQDLAALLKGVLGTTDAPEAPVEVVDEPVEESADEPVEELAESAEETVEEPKESAAEPAISADELRRQIEAEVREALEREARIKAEAEAEELRRKHDELMAENERLAEIARKAEEERQSREAERNAEAERIKAELEARAQIEARERERMAEAARLALIEQQRLAEERAEEEKRKKIEEERRLAEEKAAEEARLAEEARIAEERRLAEEARAEEERALAAEKAKAEAAAKAQEEVKKMLEPEYTYVSKTARLLFRRPIDPNVTKRIHEIILTTIKYFGKENVYIKIKATVPDATTVNLFFEKIPTEENELLIDIIKVLGKSELGITKVYLE